MKVSYRFIVLFFLVLTSSNLLLAQWTQINTNLGSTNITGLARVGSTIYAGTTTSGLFKSIDNGDTWSVYSGNDTLPSLNINGLEGDINGLGMFIYTQNGLALLQPPLALYVPPFNQTLPNKNISLYRQYSNPTTRRIVGTKGSGVFFTEDNATFVWTEATGIPAGASKNITGIMCQDITVLMLGGTENGVGMSTDRGATWTEANAGLTGDAYKINTMYSIFALTKSGLYLNLALPSFTTWTPAFTTGDYRACATDMISGIYYFFGNNVGASINLNTFAIATLSLNGISGGVVTSALLYGTNIFVGTETGGVFRASLSALTSVQDRNELPNNFILSQNYPNPFNPTTNISFSLPTKSFVSLKIFDALGREVSTLVSEEMTAGTYSKQWNANSMPSGVYFYRLQAGSFTETKKLVLLR